MNMTRWELRTGAISIIIVSFTKYNKPLIKAPTLTDWHWLRYSKHTTTQNFNESHSVRNTWRTHTHAVLNGDQRRTSRNRDNSTSRNTHTAARPAWADARARRPWKRSRETSPGPSPTVLKCEQQLQQQLRQQQQQQILKTKTPIVQDISARFIKSGPSIPVAVFGDSVASAVVNSRSKLDTSLSDAWHH